MAFDNMLDKMHAEQEKSGESLVLGYEEDLKEKVTAIRKKIEKYDYTKISKDPQESAQKASLYPTIFDETYKEIVDKTKAAVQEDDAKKARNTKKDLTNLWQNIESSSSDMPLLADSIKEILDTSTPYIDQRLKKVGGLRGTFAKMKDKTGAGLANMLQLGAVGALSIYLPTGLTALAVTATADKLKEKREFAAEEDKKIADMAAKMYTGEESQKVTRLAEGGIVTKETKAIIGEKGPEAVLPLDKLFAMFAQFGQEFGKVSESVTNALNTSSGEIKGSDEKESEAPSLTAAGGIEGAELEPSAAWMDVVETSADKIVAEQTSLLVRQGERVHEQQAGYFGEEGALTVLERIRRGVGGIPLTFGEKFGAFFTNFAGLFPHRRARLEKEKSSLKQASRDKLQDESFDATALGVEATYDVVDKLDELLNFMTGADRDEAEWRAEQARSRGDLGELKGKKEKLPLPKNWWEDSWALIVAAVFTGSAIAGLAAGMFEGISNVYKSITATLKDSLVKPLKSVLKKFGFSDDLGKAFGKQSKFAKTIASIKKFFTKMPGLDKIKNTLNSIKKVFVDVGAKLGKLPKFKEIGPALKPFTGGIAKVKQFMAFVKTWKSIPDGLSKMTKAVKGFFKPIIDVIKSVKSLFGSADELAKGGGFLAKKLPKLMTMAKSTFGFFKTVGTKLAWPLTIIISFIDGIMEGFDAFGKSTGVFATIINVSLGFLFGVIDGLIFGFADLIKSIVSWVLGFMGFTEVEKWLDSFSFSEIFNSFTDLIYGFVNDIFSGKLFVDMFEGIIDWFAGILDFSSWGAGLWSVVKLIFLPYTILFDMVVGIWNWFKGVFGFGEEDTPKSDPGGGVLGTLMRLVTGVWDWFKGLLDFSSFGAGLTSAAKLLFLPYVALMDLVGGIWDWFMGLFGWESAKITDDGQTLSGKLGDLLAGVWDWFAGLFSWGDDKKPTDDGQTVMGKLLGLVTGVWTWFKGLFDFSSFGAGLASAAKLLFLPYIALMDLVGGVWNWFMELFGFSSEDEPKDERTLSTKLFDLLGDVWTWFAGIFTFGSDDEPADDEKGFLGYIGDAISAAWGFIKKMFSFTPLGLLSDTGFFKILGEAISSMWEALTSIFDINWGEEIKTLAKSVMPGWMFDWFYDGDEPAEKESAKIETPKEATKASTALSSWSDDLPDISGILNQVDWTQFDLGSWMSFDLNFGQKLKGMLSSLFPAELSPTGGEAGGLVGMSEFGASSLGKSLGLESGGLFTLSQGEGIIPTGAMGALTDFAAGMPPSSGMTLSNLQRETEAAGGAGGSMTVVNQSTVQNNASSPLMLPPTHVRPSNSFNPASMQNNN